MTEDQYHHSHLVEPRQISEVGCFTRFPVRINIHNDVADETANQFADSWAKHFDEDAGAILSRSTKSAVGNLCSFLFPECAPERLRVLAYLTELIFRHDDLSENLSVQDYVARYGEPEEALDFGKLQLQARGSAMDKLQKVVAPVLLDAITVDRPRSLALLQALRQTWFGVEANQQVPRDFESVELCLEYRSKQAATSSIAAMISFAMDMKVTEEMLAPAERVLESFRALNIMINDRYSWDQENIDARKPGAMPVLNLVSLYMRGGRSAEDAKKAVEMRIMEEELKFQQLKAQLFSTHAEVSPELMRIVDLYGSVVSGHHYWATQCPRYHGQIKAEQRTHRPVSILTLNIQADSDGHGEGQQDAKGTGEPKPLKAGWSGSDMPWRRPSNDIISVPCDYIRSMPSKGVCGFMTNALNEWIRAPEGSADIIKEVAQTLHDASLIMDDMQDNSPIRRGKPAVHTIFGYPQAFHAANYMSIGALKQVRRLRNGAAIDIVLDEVENLHLGQSLDLNWKLELRCPTEEDYLNMIDNKTGSLFRLLSRLLQAEAAAASSTRTTPTTMSDDTVGEAALDRLLTLMGRFYQIRDDFVNLRSSEYAHKKGACEDLDEGKFSYPVVHCLTHSPPHRSHILGLFRQRPTMLAADPRPLSVEAKNHILACLEESGSLKATFDCVNELEAELEDEITMLESVTGTANPLLRLLLKKLSLADGTS